MCEIHIGFKEEEIELSMLQTNPKNLLDLK